MSFIAKMFGNGQQSQPQQQQPGPTGSMNFQAVPNGADSPHNRGATLPQGTESPQDNSPPKPIDPMERFSKIWDNPASTEAAPSYSLDDKTLGEVASSQDFMKGINPELMQKATNGDIGALMQMMNEVSRNSYKASLQHGGKLNEGFVQAREKFSEQGFSKKVGRELTVNALTGTPNFQNPVVRKQLIQIAERIQQQNPDASPEEIAQQSRDYITELGNAINPQAKPAGKETAGATDWDRWFE